MLVRRFKLTDLPALEALEREVLTRHPGRVLWAETYRALLEKALTQEPAGILVAEDGKYLVGVAVARQAGPHPLTGLQLGELLAFTVAQAFVDKGVGPRLLREAEAYLKSRGCQVLAVKLPADAGADAEVFKAGGYQVSAWELERKLS